MATGQLCMGNSDDIKAAGNEVENKSQLKLFRAAYNTLSVLQFAAYNPEQFYINTDFEIYPGENGFAFTAEDIVKCLEVYSLKFSKEVVENILEAGYLEAKYFKQERKNEKGEIIAIAYSLAKND